MHACDHGAGNAKRCATLLQVATAHLHAIALHAKQLAQASVKLAGVQPSVTEFQTMNLPRFARLVEFIVFLAHALLRCRHDQLHASTNVGAARACMSL